MREVMELAAARGVAVIEDAAQAAGADGAGPAGRHLGRRGRAQLRRLETAQRRPRRGLADASRRRASACPPVAASRQSPSVPLSELQAAVLLPQLDRLDARNATPAPRMSLVC